MDTTSKLVNVSDMLIKSESSSLRLASRWARVRVSSASAIIVHLRVRILGEKSRLREETFAWELQNH